MAEAPTPTLAQLRVMELIDEGRQRDGYAPTIRELGIALDVRSTHAVACHLEALRVKGLVNWVKSKGRTLAVTDAGRRWLKVGAAQLERDLRMQAAERRARRAA